MKKILGLLLIILSVSSCNEWLEASSSTQFKAETIYETREGFQDALSGIYINMGGSSAYGGSATWQYNDLIIYPYSIFSSSGALAQFQLRNYDNVNVKPLVEDIWSSFYNCIANVNIILENIDSHKDVFPYEMEFNWIKGECLALRAMLHFDLMRMFDQPGWNGENAEKMTIPYSTAYSSSAVPQRTYAETYQMLLSDITEAIELLADDPVTGTIPDNFEMTINSDGYWDNRFYHLNLYAAKALLARIYLWDENYEAAAQTAQEVIDAAFAAGAVSWLDCDTEIAKYSNDDKDWTFSSEHLFTLQVTGIYSDAGTYLIPVAGGVTSNYAYKLDMSAVANQLFWSSSENLSGQEDMRGTAYLLTYLDGGYISYKLYGTSSSTYRNRMPMIKISEMYYILAEKEARAGNNAAALEYLNTVRVHRAVTQDLPETTDALEELMKEYYREFINEGQTLYWCKHDKIEQYLNIASAFPNSLSASTYVKGLTYPYPDDELSYGRKQEF